MILNLFSEVFAHTKNFLSFFILRQEVISLDVRFLGFSPVLGVFAGLTWEKDENDRFIMYPLKVQNYKIMQVLKTLSLASKEYIPPYFCVTTAMLFVPRPWFSIVLTGISSTNLISPA